VQGDDHACQVRDDITSNSQNHWPGWLANGVYDSRFSLSQRLTQAHSVGLGGLGGIGVLFAGHFDPYARQARTDAAGRIRK
jgi:hypothetical protein